MHFEMYISRWWHRPMKMIMICMWCKTQKTKRSKKSYVDKSTVKKLVCLDAHVLYISKLDLISCDKESQMLIESTLFFSATLLTPYFSYSNIFLFLCILFWNTCTSHLNICLTPVACQISTSATSLPVKNLSWTELIKLITVFYKMFILPQIPSKRLLKAGWFF